MKICTNCNRCLDLSEFSRDKQKKDGLRFQCKECHKAYVKKYWNITKGYFKNLSLLKRYGITKEDWIRIFEKQNRCCAICGTANPGPKGWQTDHDHINLRVRGILCSSCNWGLGNFKDSLERLQKALVYLSEAEQRVADFASSPSGDDALLRVAAQEVI